MMIKNKFKLNIKLTAEANYVLTTFFCLVLGIFAKNQKQFPKGDFWEFLNPFIKNLNETGATLVFISIFMIILGIWYLSKKQEP